MSGQEQKHDQKRPDYKCERCWSSNNINLFSKSVFLGNDAKGFVVLCERCRDEMPEKITVDEFENLFLRFASVKELLLHYDTSDETEAIKRWQEEEEDEGTKVEGSDNVIPSSQIAFEDKNEQVPLGYRVINGECEVYQSEAEIVKGIFEKYLSGKTMEWIARYLSKKEDGAGSVWSVGSVRAILKDPIYAGYELKGQEIVEAEHDAVIEKETFNKVQQRIVRNIRNPKYLYKPLILSD